MVKMSFLPPAVVAGAANKFITAGADKRSVVFWMGDNHAMSGPLVRRSSREMDDLVLR
jgi:hypothetical protein